MTKRCPDRFSSHHLLLASLRSFLFLRVTFTHAPPSLGDRSKRESPQVRASLAAGEEHDDGSLSDTDAAANVRFCQRVERHFSQRGEARLTAGGGIRDCRTRMLKETTAATVRRGLRKRMLFIFFSSFFFFLTIPPPRFPSPTTGLILSAKLKTPMPGHSELDVNSTQAVYMLTNNSLARVTHRALRC